MIYLTIFADQGQQTYFVKGQIVNISEIVGQRVSVITNVFCYYSVKTAIKN